MIKLQLQILSFLFLLVFSSSCQYQQSVDYIENAAYHSQLHILGIDYPVNVDTSLQQIIYFSGIREKGYGIILNIDSCFTMQEINTLKLRLQRQDINAIHNYNIELQDSLKKSIGVAMEGAKFIWLLTDEEILFSGTPLSAKLKTLKKDKNSHNLLIVNNATYSTLQKLLSNY